MNSHIANGTNNVNYNKKNPYVQNSINYQENPSNEVKMIKTSLSQNFSVKSSSNFHVSRTSNSDEQIILGGKKSHNNHNMSIPKAS